MKHFSESTELSTGQTKKEQHHPASFSQKASQVAINAREDVLKTKVEITPVVDTKKTNDLIKSLDDISKLPVDSIMLSGGRQLLSVDNSELKNCLDNKNLKFFVIKKDTSKKDETVGDACLISKDILHIFAYDPKTGKLMRGSCPNNIDFGKSTDAQNWNFKEASPEDVMTFSKIVNEGNQMIFEYKQGVRELVKATESYSNTENFLQIGKTRVYRGIYELDTPKLGEIDVLSIVTYNSKGQPEKLTRINVKTFVVDGYLSYETGSVAANGNADPKLAPEELEQGDNIYYAAYGLFREGDANDSSIRSDLPHSNANAVGNAMKVVIQTARKH